jgi:hypothetical protein
MKTIIIALASAAVLSAAVLATGFALDGAAVFAILVASAVGGMFASDYSRVPTYNLEPVPAKVKAKARARSTAAGIEFATMATFNSTVG